jgi:hypothetical protein
VGRGEGYTTLYFSGALLDEGAMTFLFLPSLCAQILSSAMMALLTKSGKVSPMLSARHSCSLVESPFMKQSFFFSSVSTCSEDRSGDGGTGALWRLGRWLLESPRWGRNQWRWEHLATGKKMGLKGELGFFVGAGVREGLKGVQPLV